jgi:hypothetical protein
MAWEHDSYWGKGKEEGEGTGGENLEVPLWFNCANRSLDRRQWHFDALTIWIRNTCVVIFCWICFVAPSNVTQFKARLHLLFCWDLLLIDVNDWTVTNAIGWRNVHTIHSLSIHSFTSIKRTKSQLEIAIKLTGLSKGDIYYFLLFSSTREVSNRTIHSGLWSYDRYVQHFMI